MKKKHASKQNGRPSAVRKGKASKSVARASTKMPEVPRRPQCDCSGMYDYVFKMADPAGYGMGANVSVEAESDEEALDLVRTALESAEYDLEAWDPDGPAARINVFFYPDAISLLQLVAKTEARCPSCW